VSDATLFTAFLIFLGIAWGFGQACKKASENSEVKKAAIGWLTRLLK
jgi:hypothetical protein